VQEYDLIREKAKELAYGVVSEEAVYAPYP